MSWSVFPEACSERQNVRQFRSSLEAALACHLDRRTVCHRVGKGGAKFDNVGAIVTKRTQGLKARLKVRIASHHVGDKRSAAFGANLVEPGGNS